MGGEWLDMVYSDGYGDPMAGGVKIITPGWVAIHIRIRSLESGVHGLHFHSGGHGERWRVAWIHQPGRHGEQCEMPCNLWSEPYLAAFPDRFRPSPICFASRERRLEYLEATIGKS